jgi:hypothetical protein
MSNVTTEKTSNGYLVTFKRDGVEIKVLEDRGGRMVYDNTTVPGEVREDDYHTAYFALYGEHPGPRCCIPRSW